jgi:hypothetical protein
MFLLQTSAAYQTHEEMSAWLSLLKHVPDVISGACCRHQSGQPFHCDQNVLCSR